MDCSAHCASEALSTCDCTARPGVASSMRTSWRDRALWSWSQTATGRRWTRPAEKIQTMSSSASSGTQLTMARSQGRPRSRRHSRRRLAAKAVGGFALTAAGRSTAAFHDHTHAGPRARNGLLWPRADLEGARIEALARARGAPGGEVGQHTQVVDLEAGLAVVKARQTAGEAAALGKACKLLLAHIEHHPLVGQIHQDRKSTRLNSSHQIISYAVFCLKKKNIKHCA